MGACYSSHDVVKRRGSDPQIKKSAIDKFDERTLDDFRAAFNTFDRDGGGSIDATELKELMQSVGTTPSDAEIQEMIAMADADGSGSIDFAEFVTLMAHNMSADEVEKTDADLRVAFNIFDRSGDGNISPEELQRIMINVGEPVTLAEVDAVIAMADQDGDGEINFDEFVACVIKGGRKSGEHGDADALYDAGKTPLRSALRRMSQIPSLLAESPSAATPARLFRTPNPTLPA